MPKFVDYSRGISKNVLTAILLVLITLVTAVASVGLTSELIQAKTTISTTTESASTITKSMTVSNTITLAAPSSSTNISSSLSSAPAITRTVTQVSSITTLVPTVVSSVETDTTTVSATQTVTNTQISLVTSSSETTITTTQITPVTVTTTATSTITTFSTMPFICENTNVQTNVSSPGNSAFYGCLPTNNNWWVLNVSSANGFPLYWKYFIFSTASSYSGSPIEVLTNNQSVPSETCYDVFNPCTGAFRGNYININITTAQYAPVNVTVELSY
ncbi:MAG: hypothetical protein ACHQ1H_00220 [Nitrososphaerales archaeon]